MNWDAIGAIGEIVGAIAVVATLAYLAIQTRHSAAEYGVCQAVADVTHLAQYNIDAEKPAQAPDQPGDQQAVQKKTVLQGVSQQCRQPLHRRGVVPAVQTTALQHLR